MKTANIIRWLCALACCTALAAPVVADPAPVLVPGPVEGSGLKATGAKKGGQFPEVEEVDNDRANEILDLLAKAKKTKEEEQIVAAIDAMVTARHKKFLSPLKKLVTDRRHTVAAAAVYALGSQGNKKVAPLLLKILKFKPSRKEMRTGISKADLQGPAIESLGRLGVTGGFDLIVDVCNSRIRDEGKAKAKSTAVILRSTIRYMGLTREKRGVSFLLEHFDRPEPADPNSGTNPPASYWEARYNLWKEVLPEVKWALKEITGLEKKTGRRWKNWLEDEGKKLGMK
ncbi:MAG: HEAT repeat domain-containing protein [Planctomycetota bacterium]|jgi:hypothetical protein